MAKTGLTSAHFLNTAQSLGPHVFSFLWIGFGMVFVPFLTENKAAQVGFLISGLTIFALVLVIAFATAFAGRKTQDSVSYTTASGDENISSRALEWPKHSQMPIIVADKGGKIVLQNSAFRRIIGHKVTHIDRVFVRGLSLSPGLQSISTNEGNVPAWVTVFQSKNGLQEIHVNPCDDAEILLEEADTGMEDLPVALVKISTFGHVILANKTARHLLGLATNTEVQFETLVKGLGRSIEDWLNEALQGKARNKPEIVEAKNTPSEVYLQITLNRIVENGETYLLAVLNDATELKTLEAQFVQSQKMQAIGQLAGGVAHDFNNLLTAISGYCDLLLLRHDSDDPDFGDLIQISQNANRAASLVGQLLAFSRKQSLRLEVLDLRDILSDISHLLNRLLPDHISLSVEDAQQLLMIRADKRQLEQVIMNLVVNARDAMSDGGTVRIETENISLTKELLRERAIIPKGDYVSIKVTDSGSGIPEDKLPKIFEPFYTTKRVGEGTGLGLSTAYGIIKQTSGFIFAQSAVGVGTEFTILLPACSQPISPPIDVEHVAAVKQEARADGVILLVEDEAPVRNFAARALRMKGFTVIEADCAEEALSQLENEDLDVDVFVTDVIMPGMDGPAWVREALKRRPDVKVVFVSGYAEDLILDNQDGIPNSVFLPKPYSLNDLTATVNERFH